ncbi:hypothetical protein RUND412_002326 [Rhizina undulata]
MSNHIRPSNTLSRNLQRGQPMLLPLVRPLNDGNVPHKATDYAGKWQAWLAAARQPGDTLFFPKVSEPEEPSGAERYYPGAYVLPYLTFERDRSRYHKQYNRYGLVIEEIQKVVPVYNGGTTRAEKERSSGINKVGSSTVTEDRLRIDKPRVTKSTSPASYSRIRVYRDAQDTEISLPSKKRQGPIKFPPFAQYAAGVLAPKEPKEVNKKVHFKDPLLNLMAEELEKEMKYFGSPRNLR